MPRTDIMETMDLSAILPFITAGKEGTSIMSSAEGTTDFHMGCQEITMNFMGIAEESVERAMNFMAEGTRIMIFINNTGDDVMITR